MANSTDMKEKEHDALHKNLVENVLCGLDINQHGIQLAACNLTLGAPTVDYNRMNLVTMPHGPQASGQPKAGALEILTASDEARKSLHSLINPKRDMNELEGEQVADSARIDFPLKDLDVVIMNPPFTANKNRSDKYGPEGRKAMQLHELSIQNHLEKSGNEPEGLVTANSIRTFFTPLADMLLSKENGVLAEVIPTTACTGTSGLPERRYLADRFHIETVVTSHDPKRVNFSENTAIHESLLICRRHSREDDLPPPENRAHVSLRYGVCRRQPKMRLRSRMPSVRENLANGSPHMNSLSN